MTFAYTKNKRLHSFSRSIKKLQRRLMGQEYFVKKFDKLNLLLDRNNLVDRHIDTHGEFEKAQLTFLQSQIEYYDCRYFIDIGAHWGLYTLVFRAYFGKTIDFIAFEPDEINRNQLFANLFLNQFENIQVNHQALSNIEGTLSFSREKGSNRGANKISNQGEQTVAVTLADKVLSIKEQRLAIKIDVENHELEVLAGMTKLLKHNKCVLQIEAQQHHLPKIQALLGDSYKYLNTIEFDNYFSNFDEE